jgi:hypothetical protein
MPDSPNPRNSHSRLMHVWVVLTRRAMQLFHLFPPSGWGF